MTPKEEKDLILHALTLSDKKIQEMSAIIGALRTKLSTLHEILPTDISVEERAYLISTVNVAQKMAMYCDMKAAIDAHEDPMSAMFEAFDKGAKYAVILEKFSATDTEE